jgi:hypothetical protein
VCLQGCISVEVLQQELTAARATKERTAVLEEELRGAEAARDDAVFRTKLAETEVRALRQQQRAFD